MKLLLTGTGRITYLLARGFLREQHQVFLLPGGELPREFLELEAHVVDEAVDRVLTFDRLLLLSDDLQNLMDLSTWGGRAEGSVFLVHGPATRDYLREYHPQVVVFHRGFMTAQRIYEFFFRDYALESNRFDPFQLAYIRYPIEDALEFVGRKLKHIGAFEDLNVVGIRRQGQVSIPDGNTALMEDDILYILGPQAAIRRFHHRHPRVLRLREEELPRYLIYGKGEEARTMARVLGTSADITFLFEGDRQLGDVYLGNGDLYDALSQLSVGDFSGFIAMTGDVGEDLKALCIAAEFGQGNNVMILEDDRLVHALDLWPVSYIHPVDYFLAQEIKRAVVGPESLSLYILPGNVHILEINILPTSPAVDHTIEELQLRSGFFIGGILRGDTAILAKGQTVLRSGDRILVFSTEEDSELVGQFMGKTPESKNPWSGWLSL
ncbi:MAG: TrkA C-terminal domain-containing protein [Tissierellia bacterium]|nr:TrkA C-terminal domain-containing protein [Tissierellia bacterium]